MKIFRYVLILPLYLFVSFMIASKSFCVEEEHVIEIGRDSSVIDLKIILNDWEKIKSAIKKYAKKHDELKMTDCDFNGLTIEEIYGVGRFSDSAINKYHAEYVNLIGEGGLQTVFTRHPCFLDKTNRYVNWVFVKNKDEYQIVVDISVL